MMSWLYVNRALENKIKKYWASFCQGHINLCANYSLYCYECWIYVFYTSAFLRWSRKKSIAIFFVCLSRRWLYNIWSSALSLQGSRTASLAPLFWLGLGNTASHPLWWQRSSVSLETQTNEEAMSWRNWNCVCENYRNSSKLCSEDSGSIQAEDTGLGWEREGNHHVHRFEIREEMI